LGDSRKSAREVCPSRLFCFTAGFSGSPNGVVTHVGRSASTPVHRPAIRTAPSPCSQPCNTTVNDTTGTLTGVAFTDTLPTGLTIASPNNINGFCTGGSFASASGNSGGTTTSFINGTLTPSGGSCQYSIDIFASQAGVFTTSGLTATATGGASGVAPNFSLTVVGNIPEPTSASLVLLGLAGACWTAIRRSRKS
jgi:hypothetical protein